MTVVRADESRGKNGATKHTLICSCDVCGIECQKAFKLRHKRYHFCCREHSNIAQAPGGVLFEQVRLTNLERRYVEFPTQSPAVIEKQTVTNLARHGQSAVVLMRRAFHERYGVSNPSQLSQVIEKKRCNSLEKFGVEHPWQRDDVKRKCRETCLERYGAEHYAQTVEFKQRVMASNMTNMGVLWPMQSDVIKAKIDYRAAAVKRHETMKRLGLYRTSRAENAFFDVLVSIFGSHDVERGVIVSGHSIDFWLKSIDTYVQFDGVYWHGLDRPIEEIAQLKSKRDAVILGTIERDRRQNKQFEHDDKRLIRLTDKELMQVKYSIDYVKEQIGDRTWL